MQIVPGIIRIAVYCLCHADAVSLHILRMRADIKIKPFPQKLPEQFINTTVKDVILLPGGRDQYLFACTVRYLHLFIFTGQILQQAVTALHQLLFREAVKCFRLPDLVKLEFSHTENRIVVIQSPFPQDHCRT